MSKYQIGITSDQGYGDPTNICVDTLQETREAVGELIDIVLGFGKPGTKLIIKKIASEEVSDAGEDG